MIIPVILSGGSGTRLWPLSTAERPKQFLPLVGDESLFRQTLDRVADTRLFGSPIVVANAAHEQLCLDEIGTLEGARLILEPIARNTAAAIAMAACVARADHGDGALLLVMPSDHVIRDLGAFHSAVQTGAAAADSGRLVTYGICPTGPETGYGYLEAGQSIESLNGVRAVARFTEKPQREAAQAMIEAGDHFWNGGIFSFRADAFLEEIGKLAPDIARSAGAAIDEADHDGICVRPLRQALEDCPSISVDYAVMERSDRVAMVPLDAGWSDVGSWTAVFALNDGETSAHKLIHCENVFAMSDGPTVFAKGIRDLIIVVANGHVLVIPFSEAQDVKSLAAIAKRAALDAGKEAAQT